MKKIISLLCLLTNFILVAQNKELKNTVEKSDTIVLTKLKGKIIDVKTKFPLKSANVLNLTTVKGTITNRHGQFEITASKGDEIYFSYIGYESVKLIITNDLLNDDQLVVAIQEKQVEIKEVVVKAHHLVGVLAVDAKTVPNTPPKRVHINGIAQTYETGLPQERNYESPLAAVFSPVDFWYQKLGKKPKELKKLKKLREDDKLREIMEQKFNREVMLEYLDLSRDELNNMLKDCHYSRRFIKKASDLQIVDAIVGCYETQKIQNKGKVKKEIKHLSDQDTK